MNASADRIVSQAMRLLEGSPSSTPRSDAREVAWALKNICYESWSSSPPRSARAAEALRALYNAGVAPEQSREIEALAEWTAGIAAIIRAEMNKAVEHFDAAAAVLHTIGLADAAAQTQVPKIMALSMLGQHARATECAEIAQQALVGLGNLGAAARVSQNLGSMQLRRDDYPAAARHYREAAVLFARAGDRAHSVLADIGLADTLTAMGNFDEALHMYARARMRATNHGLGLQMALVDESVALVDLARGRYREALGGFESARRQYELLEMPQYVAVVEKLLGDTYLDLRLLPEALALFKAAVAKFAILEMPVEQAWALTQQARTEALLGKSTADTLLAVAAQLFVGERNAVGAAAITLARAELALSQCSPDAALAWADDAVQAFGTAGHADGCARAEVVRAQSMLESGRVADARAAFESLLLRAQTRQQTQVRLSCHTGLGQVAQADGKSAAALISFEAAIELFEQQRRALPGDDMRVAFLTDHLRPYLERLRLALAAGIGPDTLVQLDRFRARALDDRLIDAIAPEADAKLQPLRERVSWLVRHLQRLDQRSSASKTLMDELHRTEGELLEKTRRGRVAALPDIGGILAVAPDHALDVAALCQALGPGDALVEYGVLDDELFACVVTREGVDVCRRMAGWADVIEGVQAARFQLDTMRHGASHVQQHMDTLIRRTRVRMTRLHTLVWAPLLPALAGRRRIVLVPHAQLGGLPFAALTDGGPTLGESLELAVAPSSRAALCGLTRTPQPAHNALVLADTSRLAHAAGEAEFVSRLFAHSQVFVGEQASSENLRAHAPQADIVHLACHAQFRGDNPRFSALHLHDGPLTVDMAETLALKPCTVVLSGCETGISQIGAGDEMVGLVRAFLVAGASRVVGSLWPVDDRLTARFMALFYGALTRGSSPAAALQVARTAVMRHHPHPYAWAAFTLYGGW